ncbi:MAG TPA: hypothetical protein VN798_09705 [Pseudomonas sp.]|nr:hypothetical protein [Pseudomonas sp.]
MILGLFYCPVADLVAVRLAGDGVAENLTAGEPDCYNGVSMED